ncbi:hypothetical protein Tco_1044604 [Tanacetum coccineum]|uniref:Uncharacterized protein n=1 Tax=Tanacetum coccineum TaxID=301880 RepID=A0ABQ5GRG2_9ASTR
MGEIRGFTQDPNESLVDTWLRMKDLLRTFHGHGGGVSIKLWEGPNIKKQTMPTKVIEEEDIEETTMVGVPEINETINKEMKIGTRNLKKLHLPFHLHPKRSSMNLIVKKPCSSSSLLKNNQMTLLKINSSIFEQGQKNHQPSIQDLETKFG